MICNSTGFSKMAAYVGVPALQCVALCRDVLQCVVVCCSVLQCVAVRMTAYLQNAFVIYAYIYIYTHSYMYIYIYIYI